MKPNHFSAVAIALGAVACSVGLAQVRSVRDVAALSTSAVGQVARVYVILQTSFPGSPQVGHLNVTGTVKGGTLVAGSGGVVFPDGSVQAKAAVSGALHGTQELGPGSYPFVPPAGCTGILVEFWTAGGGGGAGGSISSGQGAGGGAGSGASGHYLRTVVPVNPGTTYRIVVGAGGLGGATAGADGQDGGVTGVFCGSSAIYTVAGGGGGRGGGNTSTGGIGYLGLGGSLAPLPSAGIVRPGVAGASGGIGALPQGVPPYRGKSEHDWIGGSGGASPHLSAQGSVAPPSEASYGGAGGGGGISAGSFGVGGKGGDGYAIILY
ncbi:MAG: hypothetical protein ACOYON_02565 [Fimbriimonas sp.]